MWYIVILPYVRHRRPGANLDHPERYRSHTLARQSLLRRLQRGRRQVPMSTGAGHHPATPVNGRAPVANGQAQPDPIGPATPMEPVKLNVIEASFCRLCSEAAHMEHGRTRDADGEPIMDRANLDVIATRPADTVQECREKMTAIGYILDWPAHRFAEAALRGLCRDYQRALGHEG